MCGISCYVKITPKKALKEQEKAALDECAATIKHRGPDDTKTVLFETVNGVAHLTFHRLEVVGQSKGEMQPFSGTKDGEDYLLVCNGEAWGAETVEGWEPGMSDCRSIALVYERDGFAGAVEYLDRTRAVFALVILTRTALMVARDRFGVRELSFGQGETAVAFASEGKALQAMPGISPHTVAQVQPGEASVIGLQTGLRDKHWRFAPTIRDLVKAPPSCPWLTFEEAVKGVHDAFLDAVKTRLMVDGPVAVFLSGGFDSTAVLGVLRHLLGPHAKIHTFSISLPGSTDEPYVLEAAKHNGTIHTQFRCTMDDVVATLSRAGYVMETFCATTIRAGAMMLILSMMTKFHLLTLPPEDRPKVIFTGEGADELAGSYLYFHDAPSDEAFTAERAYLLDLIHFWDGRRVGMTTSNAGFEVRVAFLDTDLVSKVMTIPTKWMRPLGVEASVNPFTTMEKPLFRLALAKYMPHSIATRTKEALSDGVSGEEDHLSLHKACQAYAASRMEVEDRPPFMADFPTPGQVEQAWYHLCFDRHFPCQAKATPGHWLPKWNEAAALAGESSARVLVAHKTRVSKK